ncbi:MAG: hypothetical protein LC792_16950 [Actinobacteria bacterium]|nr:hypothetical protein [Actinomycetota bacterium]
MSAWSWSCTKCQRLLANKYATEARDGRHWHWDGLLRDWCGPLVQVELRSEADE